MQVRFGLETQYVYVHINISIPAGWICWVLKNDLLGFEKSL